MQATKDTAKDYQLPDDLKDADLERLGIKLVTPKKDEKTGFVVGGKNATALIETLAEINGRSIERLEADMRPGKLSTAGFLGPDEKLLDVLAEDNKYVVDELGLTHQELAKHLHLMGAIGVRAFLNKLAKKELGDEFVYHGRKYRVTTWLARGYQESPFKDDTKTNQDVTVENLRTKKKLHYSMLVAHMVERYGFYEGKGTGYRVEPKEIVEVFDFLKEKAKKKR